MHNSIDNFCAGKIGNYLSNWQELTSDNSIIKTVTGHLHELEGLQVTGNTPHVLTLPPNDTLAIDNELQEFLKCGIIELHPDSAQNYYSTLFPRYKTDGSARVIFNLKTFNQKYVEHIHFKMDTIKDVLLMITPGCYFASIDFKHAYFSVPVASCFRHMLCFLWQGETYCFTCLPQGFSPAPRIFTKLLKPALSYLRSRGIQIICYIDDCIIIADTPKLLTESVTLAATLFDSLGLTIHPTKSHFEPTQSIEFLGFVLDSQTATWQLVQDVPFQTNHSPTR